MKQFSILRYLKQFRLLIFLVSIIGALLVLLFGISQQHYIASAVIKYTNSEAKQGYTPDGSPLNVEEIYSSSIIDSALAELGYKANIDSIRSNCYVEEVIPETQQKLSEAMLENGEDPAYIADTYRVYYVGESDTGEDYARNMLDAIIKNYYEFYAGKYVEEPLQSNGVSALEKGNYDYIESVQVLEDSVSEMLDYLLDKRESHPYFRSVETGYTYNDLYQIYNYLYNYEIPNLYAELLSDAETQDIDLLVSRLTKECEDIELSVANQKERADSLKTLIDNYSERNKEMLDYHYHNADNQDGGTEYILKDVENSEEGSGDMDHCAGLANKYYQYVKDSGDELNGQISANYLSMISSINVQPAVNLKLYVAIAIILFLLVGGVGAVLLGRALDFIDYFRYVDKTVQLPNRARCDAYINELSNRVLDEDFSCMALKMDSLGSLSSKYGRQAGDEVLKNFAMILKSFADLYGFVGYNGTGNFLAFFPNCSSEKQAVILEAIERQVAKYNILNPERSISYTCGKAVSSTDNIFEIRDLLRLALQRMNSGQITSVSENVSEVKEAEV